jgi:hypothetical protein
VFQDVPDPEPDGSSGNVELWRAALDNWPRTARLCTIYLVRANPSDCHRVDDHHHLADHALNTSPSIPASSSVLVCGRGRVSGHSDKVTAGHGPSHRPLA